MTATRSITLWAAGTLRVTAETTADGTVRISGQDFGHPLCEEYEYWITVWSGDVAALVTALGGADGADVLELLEQSAEEIVRKGEKAWLEDRGIVPGFSNRMGEPRTTGDRRPPTAAPKSWDDLAARVADVLKELEADEYLVLEAAANRFVQGGVQDFVLRIESVGDQYLDQDAALTPEQAAALTSLGYQQATHNPEADDDTREGSPNYWVELPTETPLATVAKLMVDTLQAAHEVRSPRDLAYTCSTSLGEFIPQPALGLARLPDE